MSVEDEELIPVFVPSLSAVLLNTENEKGQPLTYEEVIQLRDNASCKMAGHEQIARLAESRGYEDIDPENCWYDWQHLRRELGREPELDPGPNTSSIVILGSFGPFEPLEKKEANERLFAPLLSS